MELRVCEEGELGMVCREGEEDEEEERKKVKHTVSMNRRT